ncbi:MAG: tripartite tricarboxylate transporter substrate binding protein [Betaproteobacteria bacterium]|nr:MAG: tripartite tricarboxylate transporter substrate binding protein [Betaproteobacteria bacterium]
MPARNHNKGGSMKAWLGLLMAASAALAMQAFGQGYPNKPVHVIISFTPGSSTDIVGRIVSQKLSDIWNQPVVPENRAGAGGSIGSAIVAKAAADGYTLLINSNAHSVNPAIYAKLPYDTAKDFTDIAPLALQPNVLVVNAGAPYKSLMDLVNAAKANPGAINWGHAGIGSGTHLNTEKFIAAANVNVTQVPFKGTPEVIQAMFSGSVDCYWVPISAGMSHIKSGKLRPLAVSTAKRNPTLPDVPTTGEAGVKDADAPLWFGLWGPTGMPADLVNKINIDVRRALADPGVKERLANLGNDTMDMSPQEFARFVRSEIEDYQRVVRNAGIKPQ